MSSSNNSSRPAQYHHAALPNLNYEYTEVVHIDGWVYLLLLKVIEFGQTFMFGTYSLKLASELSKITVDFTKNDMEKILPT